MSKIYDCFRSHKDLLKLSSTIFYDGELVSCANKKLVDVFMGSSILPNPNIPLILHGLRVS